MTLKELSKCYEEAAVPLRQRLSELRKKLKETDDPEEIWHLKRRIAELTPMLTQMNDLAWLLEHYYERSGAVRDERYGFNGICKPPKKRETDEDLAPDIARRVNRLAARSVPGLLFPEEKHHTNSERTGSEQKHHLPDTEACGTESAALHEIFADVSDLVSASPKRKRRIT